MSKKLNQIIGEALLPIALERTAKLRAPAEEPSVKVKHMMTLMKIVNKGLGAGPGQAWATLTGMVTGNADILKAAELLGHGPGMYQVGQIVVVERDTVGHGRKNGDTAIIYAVEGLSQPHAINISGTNFAFSQGQGDSFKTDVRPATDEEINAYCADLPAGALIQIATSSTPLNLLLS
jgi:hypothetical protein